MISLILNSFTFDENIPSYITKVPERTSLTNMLRHSVILCVHLSSLFQYWTSVSQHLQDILT